MKIGYIIDSSSGITKKEAEKKGLFFLPLVIQIDEKMFNDGSEEVQDNFLEIIEKSKNCKTSSTPPGIISETIEKALSENDFVFIYPISKELSSQYSHIKTIAKNYKNVFVIPSSSIGPAILKGIYSVQGLKNVEEVKEKLLSHTKEIWGVLLPKKLDRLIKGGRISHSVASMANLLKIVPIIKFESGRLEKFGKGRNFSKTLSKCAKFIKENFPDRDYIVYRGNYEGIWNDIDLVKENLGSIEIFDLPNVVACHTGNESVVILAIKKNRY